MKPTFRENFSLFLLKICKKEKRKKKLLPLKFIKTSQLLEMTEMKKLRRIMNVTGLDRMKSEDIREKCGIQKVGEWIKRRRTEWYAHVGKPTCKESDDEQAGRNKK